MNTEMPTYTVRRAPQPPGGRGDWNDPAWTQAEPLELAYFFPHSSDHRPRTRARLLHDDRNLYVLFHVADRYVRSQVTEYQGMVCRDSCVEFFVKPRADQGYFNFEINAGGSMLLYHIPHRDTWTGKLENAQPVPWELGQTVKIHHSLPARIEPEIAQPTDWTIEYTLPVALLEQYVGPLAPLAGQTWRANFYKCGDAASRPHWGMWSPIREGRSFHRPDYFGALRFA